MDERGASDPAPVAPTAGSVLQEPFRVPPPQVPPPPDPKGPRPRVTLGDDLRRSRVLVLLRLPLAVPHVLWAALWTTAVVVVAPLAWLVALALGRLPRPLHRFLRAYARELTQLGAFVGLAANPFPGFVGTLPYPLDLHVGEPVPQRRIGILLRSVTVLPALVVCGVAGAVGWVVWPIAWLIALVRGRLPSGLAEVLAFGIRFQALTLAYGLLLTRRYPTFGGDPR